MAMFVRTLAFPTSVVPTTLLKCSANVNRPSLGLVYCTRHLRVEAGRRRSDRTVSTINGQRSTRRLEKRNKDQSIDHRVWVSGHKFTSSWIGGVARINFVLYVCAYDERVGSIWNYAGSRASHSSKSLTYPLANQFFIHDIIQSSPPHYSLVLKATPSKY